MTTTNSVVDIRRSYWTFHYARGFRHHLDVAPFSFWDKERQDHNFPKEDQVAWIVKNYNASHVEWWPDQGFYMVFTDTPALLGHEGLVTPTIAPTPVMFAPMVTQDTILPIPPTPNSISYSYLSLPDPLPLFNFQPWTGPSTQEAQKIFEHLDGNCNVYALNFIFSSKLYVELAGDGRQYELGSLPHQVAASSCRWMAYFLPS